MPKKVKNFELLYDSIKDGSNAGAFHKKCDAKKPTITFVKTKKNRRFGGYTEKTWNESNGNYIIDENAFQNCKNLSRDGKVTVEEYVEMPSLEIIEGDIFVNDNTFLWNLFTTRRSTTN